MILEKNNLKTAQEWTKSYIELIASYVHPKNSNNLWSHLRAIMALDHRRLVRPGKKKSGRIFCVRQVYFTRSCQQIWVRVNEPFIPFIHHIWGETVLWDTASSFIIQTSERMQYFTILQYRLYSFNIQDDRSTRGLLARPALKKITYTASRFSLLRCELWSSVWMNIMNRVTLQHNKKIIVLIFLFNGFIDV